MTRLSDGISRMGSGERDGREVARGQDGRDLPWPPPAMGAERSRGKTSPRQLLG